MENQTTQEYLNEINARALEPPQGISIIKRDGSFNVQNDSTGELLFDTWFDYISEPVLPTPQSKEYYVQIIQDSETNFIGLNSKKLLWSQWLNNTKHFRFR